MQEASTPVVGRALQHMGWAVGGVAGGQPEQGGMELPPPPKLAFGLVQPGVPLGWGGLISHESIEAERAV